MRKLGHTPARETARELWYLSPLREERTPSFKISKQKNLWYDFGAGRGGNTLDLVMAVRDCGVAEALRFLRGLSSADTSAFHPLVDIPPKTEEPFPLEWRGPVESEALLAYGESRGVPRVVLRANLEEIHYRRGERSYFALAFFNEEGGCEIRNAFFKGSRSPKAPTFAPGARPNGALNVFEGCFDYLSALAVSGTVAPEQDALILNSLAFVDQALRIAPSYRRVRLFLDNDSAGRAAAARFDPAENIAPLLYPRFKDLNEALKAGALDMADPRLRV